MIRHARSNRILGADNDGAAIGRNGRRGVNQTEARRDDQQRPSQFIRSRSGLLKAPPAIKAGCRLPNFFVGKPLSPSARELSEIGSGQ